MVILAILNQKGGVRKTNKEVTFASGFAQTGYSVLLIDLDTQGNVTDCFRGLYGFFSHVRNPLIDLRQKSAPEPNRGHPLAFRSLSQFVQPHPDHR